MGRLPSWIIVAAVGAVIVLAAADSLRSTGERATKASVAATEPTSTTESEPGGLHGVIVVGSDCSSIQAIRLPTLISFQPPRQTDCNGYRWSRDGTLYARCEGRTTEVGTSEGRPEFSIAGCEPAWRPDGALTVIRNGSLVVTRSIGRPSELLTRTQLGEALEGAIPRPQSYTLTQVAWLDSNHLAAIAHGARPGEQALIVLSALIGELQYSDPQVAAGLADLRASPFGDYIAYVRAGFIRRFTMIDLQGSEVRLPPIGNALNVAWSPDEKYVAISTRATTFIARTGTERVLFEVPAGGESLAWLP
jgi:hypothetical protein